MELLKNNNLHEFLNSDKIYQLNSRFEFRYPILFDDNSFLIDQIVFPKIEANIGNIWIDGFAIPVHSTAKFDNDITFTMYVPEHFLQYEYNWIFNSFLSDKHSIIDNFVEQKTGNSINDFNAYLIPLSSEYIKPPVKSDFSIELYNAKIKSISMPGGFSANSQALAKFDIALSYSFFEIKKNDNIDNGRGNSTENNITN
jgi:hypothetical protein